MFNETLSIGENRFIKHKASMLNHIYNTTDVFPYWVADLDFQVAKPITQELERLVARGVYSYEFVEQDVFSAIANWYQKRHQLTFDPQKFVQVPGVLSGIALLLRQLTNEGDGVLVHTPAYHQFSSLVNKANRQLVNSSLIKDEQQYRIDYDDLEAKLALAHVKAMIFCNPHNPTGRVWHRDELAKVIAIAKRHNVLVISDEVHSDIIFNGHQFTSLTSFDYDNVVALIGSPAKTFGMHSIANGYIYANNDKLIESIRTNIAAMYLDHGNALSAFATIAAFENGAPWLDGMLSYLQDTIRWINNFVAEHIPQLHVYQPQGTYQMWFDFNQFKLSETQLKQRVFEQAKMGLTPGGWFSADDHNLLRMNIATQRSQIMASFELLAKALANVESSVEETLNCSGKRSTSCC